MDLTLNTGTLMPRVGLGTWKSPLESAGQAVEYALTEAGYRHIDCAAIYKNEKEIGRAFKKVFAEGVLKRDEVFITSKLWNSAHRKNDVVVACKKKTLSDLGLDYLDLYLVHWGIATPSHWAIPTNGQEVEYDANGRVILEKVPMQETWEAMESLVQAGLVRAIGVANFTAPMLIDLCAYAHIPPAMNQIELHPYFQQSRLVEFCQDMNIAVTAYSPLGSPGNYATSNLLKDPLLTTIARAHNKTEAQVALRFGIERDTIVIPKSIHKERIRENEAVFDFTLSQDEMSALSALDTNKRLTDPYVWGKIPYFN